MRNRTLALIGGGLVAGALTLGTLGTVLAQTPPQPGPQGPGWGPGGMMGGSGPMHGGMMGDLGDMMGRAGFGGMSGMSGMSRMMGMMGNLGWTGTATATPLTSLSGAQQAFERYLQRLDNDDLALAEVMEFEGNFYAIAKERSAGIGAFELLANKQTGAVFPEFGPNMMWNTRYGHMGQNSWMAQMMGYQAPSGPMTVSPERAKQLAQQWLDQNQPGAATETPDTFYGYYTLHVLQDGKITGMLSVNGYTGQVWYHTWHGPFVAELEVAH
ncbi:MAG: hypothetical protein HY332_17080 [Chloroflexi bacterium]|nr:hypothetical protein [Chloroflexota bacterium]